MAQMMTKSNKTSDNKDAAMLDRRGFVSGAAIGMAGVAGAYAVAGSGMPGSAMASESSASADAAADVNTSMTNIAPIDPVAAPQTWDYEADAIVVGAGGGGLNAAARLAELGASVILVEKTTIVGGNSAEAGGSMVNGGCRATDEAQQGWPQYPYDPDEWVKWIEEAYGQELDATMLRVISTGMGEAHDWMETAGVIWYPQAATTLIPVHKHQQFGVSARIQADVTDTMYEYGQQLGAQYLLGTAAQALVVDGDRVVGIKALADDNSDIYLHANKGVILCGGGFASNKDMLAQYAPDALRNCLNCYVSQTDSGECDLMAIGAGGYMTGLDSYSMFDGGIAYEDYGGEWCTYLYNGANQLVRQPWLTIDRNGNRKRYITSNSPIGMHSGALTEQANIHTSSPDHRSFVIFDANYEQSMAGFDEIFCRKPVEPTDIGVEVMPEHFQDWRNGVADAIESGVIASADTIEELAEKLGLDPEILSKSVEDWNAVCEKGEDDALYPYDAKWLVPIQTAPFYGAKVGGILFRTDTGVAINDKMQVIREDGTAIPGLYAGWFTASAAQGCGGIISNIAYLIGGVSLSYTGGYLCANSLMEQE